MHRVNTKKRRLPILRLVAYGLTITLSILTTVLLVYTALGYDIDRESHRIVRNGLLLVNAQPSDTGILIDEQGRTDVPGRFVLRAGEYDVALQREGYRNWAKKVTITPSQVENLRYPILIPEKLSSQLISSRSAPRLVSQSSDQKVLLVQYSAGSSPVLVRLDGDNTTSQNTAIGDLVSGSINTFQVLDWSDDSNRVLLEHSAKNGNKELLSVDIQSPERSINVTRLYRGTTVRSPRYQSNEAIYGLSSRRVLGRYSLTERQINPLAQNIYNYDSSGGRSLVFVRQSADSPRIEFGATDGSTETVLRTLKSTDASTVRVKSIEYDGRWYAALFGGSEKNTELYRDPLDRPILDTQLPFTSITFQATTAQVSGNSRFILLRNGRSGFVYDLDTLRSYNFMLEKVLRSNTSVQWSGNNHISFVDQSRQSYIMDFDGSNLQPLVRVSNASMPHFVQSLERFYYFNQAGLQRTSLLPTER